MVNLLIISLVFGMTSATFVTLGFTYESYNVYKTKSNETLTWGSLGLQVVASSSGAICASINIYNSGIDNIPFLITNTSILINLIALCIMKRKYRVIDN